MLLLGGAESTRKSKHMQGHVAIAAPKEGRRRPIIRSKRACSGSNRRTVSTSPLPCRPRRAAFPFWHEPVFHEIPRAAGPPPADHEKTMGCPAEQRWRNQIGRIARLRHIGWTGRRPVPRALQAADTSWWDRRFRLSFRIPVPSATGC